MHQTLPPPYTSGKKFVSWGSGVGTDGPQRQRQPEAVTTHSIATAATNQECPCFLATHSKYRTPYRSHYN